MSDHDAFAREQTADELRTLRAEVASLRADLGAVSTRASTLETERDMLKASYDAARAELAEAKEGWAGCAKLLSSADDDFEKVMDERDAARAELDAMTTARDNALTYYGNECAETRRLRAALEGFVTRAHEHKTPDCCKHDGYSLGFRDGINEAALVARAALAPHDKGTTNNG